eukprot:CAMPEP_0184699374 /NCGR_PEP_ID=MMETSP0313-20130426/5667_1 /TAXON_ID=2792 /ORGANISM="Porphyridium aerugineum, Strain SAG 1380-2" /LENGTH=38 /DNA_ID= /DNA_START= /DNA_END= /DNA_ORIENTATION=
MPHSTERALTKNEVRRGMFMNSGSVDVGPDPNAKDQQQ